MSKKEDLQTLDELVRKKMIEMLKDGKTEMLSDLSTPITYLAKNNLVEDKVKTDTAKEEADKRLKEAEERRKNG